MFPNNKRIIFYYSIKNCDFLQLDCASQNAQKGVTVKTLPVNRQWPPVKKYTLFQLLIYLFIVKINHCCPNYNTLLDDLSLWRYSYR